MTTEIAYFYNLRELRPHDQVQAEVTAMLNTQPVWFIGCEGVGYRFAAHPNYLQIRDFSKPGRENIVIFVRQDQGLPEHLQWTDLQETWKNPHQRGDHWPRSIVSFRLNGHQIVGHQQPQRGTANTTAAQAEGQDALTKIMAPWTRKEWRQRSLRSKVAARLRKRLAVADWNGVCTDHGTTPCTIAKAIRGHVYGSKIDAMIARRFRIASTDYLTHVGHVQMLSDHKHCVKFTISNW